MIMTAYSMVRKLSVCLSVCGLKVLTQLSFASFSADKLISLGVVALIGPLTSAPLPVIGPLTSVAHVPQILPLTSWDTSDLEVGGYEYLLRMSPTEKLKAQVMIDIVKHYKWKRVAVLSLRGDQYPECKDTGKKRTAHARELQMKPLVNSFFTFRFPWSFARVSYETLVQYRNLFRILF